MSKAKCERLKKGVHKYRYPIVFVLFCIFFAAVPYVDDDLRWGSVYGLRRLKSGFQDYGGRYLGYLISLILTRSAVLKTIYMGAVTSGVVYLMERLSKRRIAFYITLFAVVSMPMAMFNNTIAWVSGFANYMTSILLTLIYVRSLYDLIEQNVGGGEAKMGSCHSLCFAGIFQCIDCGTFYFAEHCPLVCGNVICRDWERKYMSNMLLMVSDCSSERRLCFPILSMED